LSPPDEFNNPNRLSAMIHPGPADVLGFLDERADSIDDGYFGVDMVNPVAQAEVVNIPANYHLGCSAMSFGDGHGQMHRWMDPRTEPPMTPYVMIVASAYISAPNDQDIAWLQQHSSAPR
jgi:hypothetical protein